MTATAPAQLPAPPDFTPEQYARSRSRKRATSPVHLTSLGTQLALVSVLGFTGLGAGLCRDAGRLVGGDGNWIATALLGALAVRIVLWAAGLPFSLWRERIDREWAISTRSTRLYWLDQARALVIGALLMPAVALGFFTVTRHAAAWPVITAAAGVLLVFVMSFLFPVLLEPIFNKFRPMDAGDLRDRITELADQSGVHIRDVLVSDASKRTVAGNAYVSGFGRTRRVVVWDTTIEHCTTEETAGIAAHELGHAVRRDVITGTAVGAGGVVAGVAVLAWALSTSALRNAAHVTGAADPKALPLILAIATILGMLGDPLFNAYSRHIERRADTFALELTQDPAAMIATWRRLGIQNLADLEPHPLKVLLFFTHPAIPERIANARAWTRRTAP